jgi:SAM-dependent methyltransferase
VKCRHCGTALSLTFIDLGSAPPSNAYLTERDLKRPERWYPLRILVCAECWLVQTEDYAGAEDIFTNDYAYFSSYSKTWLEHCENYVDRMTERFQLGPQSFVVELAANDGYLLQYVAARKIPCLGIEPTASTAASARAKGIEIVEKFFGVGLARELASTSGPADLVTANNVLAHVPDINDFVSGIAILLKPNGVATFEFPHFLNLVAHNQFDTIYHEHYSYLSLLSVRRIMERNGLSVFDVEELPTHGGSLRIYAQRTGGPQPLCDSVESLLQRELTAGLGSTSYYAGFQAHADKVKNDFLNFLLLARRGGESIAAYGAAAKGNTLLNYAGIRPDLLPYVVDKSPSKQDKFLPGSRIPIVSEDRIRRERPNYVVILPWNIRDEVMADLGYIRSWGGRFVTAVPELRFEY